MSECRVQTDVERWFDGELPGDAKTIEAHLDQCPACRDFVAFLKQTRRGVAAVAEDVGISDAQLPAFMASLHESMDRRPPGIFRRTGFFRNVWAISTVACAALISAVSLLVILGSVSEDKAPVSAATVVESHSTELPGAHTSVTKPGGTTFIKVEGWGSYDYDTEGDMM